jgi:hypothetical protein
VRQRSFTAASSRDFSDADVLRLLNERATTYLVRMIAKRNTNYLVEHVDLPVSAAVAQVPIPSVAVAGAVRAVTLLVAGIPYALIEMSLAQAAATNLTPLSTQFPVGYYFEGPNIVLWPTQTIGGTLRVHYHRRPSQIVMPSACVQITGFPLGAADGYYRVSYAGTAPAGYVPGASVDVVSNIPNFYRWQTNVVLGVGAAGALDLPGPLPPALQVGDWVCLYDTAPVVTDAPAEVIDALCEAVACDMLMAKGSDASYQRMLSGLARKEEDCGPLIQQRNTGAMRKISAFPDVSGWPWAGW